MTKPKNPDRLGDAPIEAHRKREMENVAAALDKIFNGDKTAMDRDTGFVLLVFPFGGGGDRKRCNYISNAERADIVVMLKEIIARTEGQPMTPGRA